MCKPSVVYWCVCLYGPREVYVKPFSGVLSLYRPPQFLRDNKGGFVQRALVGLRRKRLAENLLNILHHFRSCLKPGVTLTVVPYVNKTSYDYKSLGSFCSKSAARDLGFLSFLFLFLTQPLI